MESLPDRAALNRLQQHGRITERAVVPPTFRRRLVIPGRTRWRQWGFVGVVLLTAGVVGLAGGAATRLDHSNAKRAGQGPQIPAAFSAAPTQVFSTGSAASLMPTPAGVRAALAAKLADAKLGKRVSAQVVDVQTGEVLLDQGSNQAATPASTAKLTTAVAALGALAPDSRFATRVVSGAQPGEIVLVGGGDPTLSAAGKGQQTVYPEAGRLSDLADQVKKLRIPINHITLDTSLYAGPALHPTWNPADVPAGFIAPITSLMTDAGRVQLGLKARSTAPDVLAGQQFAAMLGVSKESVSEGQAPANSSPLAQVQSPPLLQIIEYMLLNSDNVLAENLARQVAIAQGKPASFVGGADAVRQQLNNLGVDITGEKLIDGSGLSTQDKVSPATLVSLLRTAATSNHPWLRGLFSGLPVNGYSGTLADRYKDPADAALSGRVRAKTGTLDGVSSLAGLVKDADGRELAFAYLADGVPIGGTLAAEDGLDAAALTLARCGCR